MLTRVPSLMRMGKSFYSFWLVTLVMIQQLVRQKNQTAAKFNPTEIAGSRGTRFKVDPGIRASISLNHGARFASDPDIFKCPDGYCLLISRGQGCNYYTAQRQRRIHLKKGLLKFSNQKRWRSGNWTLRHQNQQHVDILNKNMLQEGKALHGILKFTVQILISPSTP